MLGVSVWEHKQAAEQTHPGDHPNLERSFHVTHTAAAARTLLALPHKLQHN
jgi:hypothetical protein